MYGSLTPTPVLANVLHPSEAAAIVLGVKIEELGDENVFLYFIKIRKIMTVWTKSKLENARGYELKLKIWTIFKLEKYKLLVIIQI